jgi:quercetin dioxygenase-like cupin family protein
VEIRRFGVGNRRPDGPPRTTGVAGQVIHADARGVVSELAFARRAAIEPHSNPNTTWFLVIEGGGWAQVGEERARVAAGEAVLWPADVVHAAWTELSEMRAIVVEYAGADDAELRGILAGRLLPLPPGDPGRDMTGDVAPGAGAAPADGELRQAPPDPRQAAVEGEPL